jgi:hypothetical protein
VIEKEKFIMTIPSKVSSDVSTSSSDLLGQLSSIMDQKIAESQKFTNDLLVNLIDHVLTFTKGKSADSSYSVQTEPSASVAPASAQ